MSSIYEWADMHGELNNDDANYNTEIRYYEVEINNLTYDLKCKVTYRNNVPFDVEIIDTRVTTFNDEGMPLGTLKIQFPPQEVEDRTFKHFVEDWV